MKIKQKDGTFKTIDDDWRQDAPPHNTSDEDWRGFTELRLKPHMKGKWPSGKLIRKAVQRSKDFDKKDKDNKA